MKPNFLYIGASRAGSTWLYKILTLHPNIFIPEAKDIYFFDKNYHKGIHWYENLFKNSSNKHVAIGEISHDYLFHPEAPQRIFQYNPNMRLIIHLRDPVQRLISRYNFYRYRAGGKSLNIINFIDFDPIALEEGFYAKHLNNYLKYFNSSQIYLVDFEIINHNPQKYISQLLTFLHCPDLQLPLSVLKEKILASKEPRLKIMNRLLAFSAKKTRQFGLLTLLGKIKHSNLVENLLYKQSKFNTEIQLTQFEEKHFATLYRSDIKKTASILSNFPNRIGKFEWIKNYNE